MSYIRRTLRHFATILTNVFSDVSQPAVYCHPIPPRTKPSIKHSRRVHD
jgi:hypothetical protein